jgi:hypothetical protein
VCDSFEVMLHNLTFKHEVKSSKIVSVVETTRLTSLNRVIKTTVSKRSVPRVVVSM